MREILVGILSILLLSSCGRGQVAASDPPQPPAMAPAPDLTTQGEAVVKFRAAGSGWAALVERLRVIEDVTAPDRRLLLAMNGTQSTTAISPPPGWSLIDFAIHPSGQISLILANNTELRLQRRTADGTLLADSSFVDAEASTDPFFGDLGQIDNSRSLVPKSTRDAARLAPIGEDLLATYRTGRNAVIVQRLSFTTAGNFNGSWRTIVEPGVPIYIVRLTGGTFDPFSSLDNQWHVLTDVAEGRIAVAVRVGGTELTTGHRQFFGEPLDPALVSGAIVTVLDLNGRRLSATPIDTHVPSEVHTLRWSGDMVLLAGRQFTARKDDGTGWDGFLAAIRNGSEAAMQILDFDQGDVILDVATLNDGRIVLVGTTAYTQNPNGGSVSESAESLLAVIPQVGAPPQHV